MTKGGRRGLTPGKPMTAVEIQESLENDHALIRELVRGLERAVSRAATDRAGGLALLSRMLRLLIDFGDLYHHSREDLAYDQIRSSIPPSAAHHLERIQQDHEHLSGRLEQLRSKLEAVQAEQARLDDLSEILTAFGRWMHEHLEAEETHLFPLFQALLSGADARALSQWFDAVEVLPQLRRSGNLQTEIRTVVRELAAEPVAGIDLDRSSASLLDS